MLRIGCVCVWFMRYARAYDLGPCSSCKRVRVYVCMCMCTDTHTHTRTHAHTHTHKTLTRKHTHTTQANTYAHPRALPHTPLGALKEEGLFRLSGDATAIQRYRDVSNTQGSTYVCCGCALCVVRVCGGLCFLSLGVCVCESFCVGVVC